MERNAWPYVAGIFDGEGCVCLHMTRADYAKQPNHCSLQVLIYNTSVPLMKWLITNFGGKYYTRTKNDSPLSKKTQYVWHPSGRKNRENFLLGILPYLVIKQEQAKIALEFLRIGDQVKSPALRRELVARCSFLNNQSEESVETIRETPQIEGKIWPELIGDYESDPVETQVSLVI